MNERADTLDERGRKKRPLRRLVEILPDRRDHALGQTPILFGGQSHCRCRRLEISREELAVLSVDRECQIVHIRRQDRLDR